MAKWSTIQTDFPGSSMPSGFNGYGIWSVSGNQLRFTVNGSNYAGAVYYGQDLTASYVMAKVGRGTSNSYVEMAIYVGGTYRAYIRANDGANTISFRVGGTVLATITYSATDHAWWRIREAGGTTYCETSPDGTDGSWTVRGSAANSGSLTSCDCDLGGGGGTTGTFATFEKFNMVPAASGTDITHTKPTAVGTASSSVALGALALTHTSPSVASTAAAPVAQALALAHSSPSGVATASSSVALGGLTLTHTSPSVVARVSGDTAEAGGGTAITHTKPTLDAQVGSAVQLATALTHSSPTATGVVAGAPLPVSLSVLLGSPTIEARASSTFGTVVALTHSRPTATATAGQTLVRLQPITHTRPAATLQVAVASIVQGALVLTLQAHKVMRAWDGEEPLRAWAGEAPIAQFETEEVSLVH
jgi:hypothetical protein